MISLDGTEPHKSLSSIIENAEPGSRLHRLITGFSPLGFSLVAIDGFKISFEFRSPDVPLRFIIRGGEGGVFLIWTELKEPDLLTINLHDLFPNIPDGVKLDTFSDSDSFWRTVNDVVAGHCEAKEAL